MESKWDPSAKDTRNKSDGDSLTPSRLHRKEMKKQFNLGQALGLLARLGYKHYCSST